MAFDACTVPYEIFKGLRWRGSLYSLPCFSLYGQYTGYNSFEKRKVTALAPLLFVDEVIAGSDDACQRGWRERTIRGAPASGGIDDDALCSADTWHGIVLPDMWPVSRG